MIVTGRLPFLFLATFLFRSSPAISSVVNSRPLSKYRRFIEQIPSLSCFRRKLKTLPFAVTEYAREGEKAFHDHCTPYANRDKSSIYANDIWVMDNYTFDYTVVVELAFAPVPAATVVNQITITLIFVSGIFSIENIRADFSDVKSGVLVGWNITDSPDSNSTLDALRFAMLRFGIPKRLYFDNGREFTTLDIAGGVLSFRLKHDNDGICSINSGYSSAMNALISR